MAEGLGALQSADDNPRGRPTDRARLCGRNRRSFAHPSIARCRRSLSGLATPAVSVGRGRSPRRRHIEMRGQAGANPPVRGRQRCADALQGPARAKDWAFAIARAVNDAQGPGRSGSPPRDHYARNAARRIRVHIGLAPRNPRDRRPDLAPKRERRPRGEREQRTVMDCVARGQPTADCVFNSSCSAPSLPHQAPASAQRTQAPESVDTGRGSRP